MYTIKNAVTVQAAVNRKVALRKSRYCFPTRRFTCGHRGRRGSAPCKSALRKFALMQSGTEDHHHQEVTGIILWTENVLQQVNQADPIMILPNTSRKEYPSEPLMAVRILSDRVKRMRMTTQVPDLLDLRWAEMVMSRRLTFRLRRCKNPYLAVLRKEC